MSEDVSIITAQPKVETEIGCGGTPNFVPSRVAVSTNVQPNGIKIVWFLLSYRPTLACDTPHSVPER